MFGFWRRIAIVAFVAPLLGGCPLSSLSGDAAGESLSDTNVASSAATSPAPPVVVRPTSSFEQQLSARFPNCRERVNVERERDRIMQLVNEARAAAGAGPVRRNETLERQASQYACEMIEGGFFSHVNPLTNSTLRDRAEEFGYDFRVIGENLAGGQETAEKAFNDWMNSPAHRDNILDPRFTEIGIGVRTGGDYGVYWVQEFGLPAE